MKEDSDTQEPKKENKEKSNKSRAAMLFERLDFAQISEIEGGGKDPEDSKSKKENDNDPHSFPLLSDIIGSKRAQNIKSRKSTILVIIGVIVGVLFIVLGAVMIMGSAERVADNVAFGEKEVFSVFLILIGVIIIACSFAYKFVGKSFFKEIDDEVNSYDEKSSPSAKNNIKKDNINRDNKYKG
ncbi:MAG: DUF308 domain-containing protein [Methanobacterium sp.]